MLSNNISYHNIIIYYESTKRLYLLGTRIQPNTYQKQIL